VAAVVTTDTNLTYFSFPIAKQENTEEINPVDGTPDIVIWGKATDGTVDSDRQIVDPVWSATAIQKWLETGGNIRQSHDAKKPVGKGLQVEVTPDGHYVKSLIADPLAKHFVRNKILNDYSVGISNPDIKYGHNKALDPDFKAINGIITGRHDGSSEIAEISICDRGSNYGTKFQIAGKSAGNDGGAEFVGKMFATHSLVTKSATPELAAASNLVELDPEEETITVSVPKSASISFSPSSLAKLLEHKRIAEEREAEQAHGAIDKAAAADTSTTIQPHAATEQPPAAEPDPEPEQPAETEAEKTATQQVAKRDFDRNVGNGGVDRDALPTSAFVFPATRDFPVTTPGDVSDASSSWGRYKGPESHETFKKNLMALAQRKGDSFVAELPAAWKDEMTDSTKAQEPQATATAEPEVEKRFADDGSGDGGAGNRVNPADAAPSETSPAAEPSGDPTNDEGVEGETETGGSDDTDEDNATKGQDAAEAAKAAKPKAGKKPGKAKPFAGAAEPFDSEDSDGKDTDGDGNDTDKSATEPEVAKAGSKTCTNCGKSYHADAKIRRCESCNTKLPKADKHTHAGVGKAAKTPCAGCGTGMSAKHQFCPGCGKKVGTMPDADKSEDPATTDAPTEAAEADKSAQSTNSGHDAKEEARAHRGSPTPSTGVGEPPREAPVPEHREPDGPYIEAFEADNGIPTMPDSEVHSSKTADPFGLLKAAGEPVDLLAIHDLTCAAYHPDTAAKAHPYHGLEALDERYWEHKALAYAAEGSLADGRRYGQLWEHARTLKFTDPTLVYQLGAEQHEAFKAANPAALPGPGSFPRPGEIHAGSFNRPYIASGHAAASPGYDSPNSALIPTDQINAAEYQRGLITTGHGADSPGNSATRPSPVASPTVNGIPSRVFYTNGQRDQARQAMAAMHDHIAETFPDLCPLHGPGYEAEKPIGARPVPTPVGVPTPAQAPATKAADDTATPAPSQTLTTQAATETVKHDGSAQPTPEQLQKAMNRVWAGELTIDQARTDLGLAPLTLPGTTDTTTVAAAVKGAEPQYFTATLEQVDLTRDTEVIKAAVAAATAPLITQLEAQSKALKKQAKLLDNLAGQPDPNGPARKRRSDPVGPVPQISAAPAEPLTANKRAALAQEADLAEWLGMFRNDPDPARREVAWQEMNRLYQNINNRTA
jgi:hypothetical protein